MAKKETTPAEPATMAPPITESTALATAPSETLAVREDGVPSWIPEGDTTGTEMSADDLRLPRLSIAQGLSPELTPGNPQYNPDLKMFQLFNNLTQEIYGMGPLIFVPVRHDVRWIEFKPRSEGGGVVDMNVPPNDPRTLWRRDPGGDRKKDQPPIATKFNEYVVLLVQDGSPEPEPIVISIKDTNKENRRAATNLNGYIALPTVIPTKQGKRKVRLPIYGKMYSVESGTAKNDKGTYGVHVIKQVGVVMDAILGNRAMQFLKMIEGKNINVEREAPTEDEIDSAADAPTPEM
jgi:hypothetical protein